MNAEVFAKGLENCKLLTRLLGQNVENLDDYGCPKVQDLLVQANSSWICSSYPFRHKTRLHCAERKTKVFGEWAMQQLLILYVFIVFVFNTNFILSTRHGFVFSIHFEKLSLRKRWRIKKIILIQVKLSLTTTIKRGNLGLVWDKPVPDL